MLNVQPVQDKASEWYRYNTMDSRKQICMRAETSRGKQVMLQAESWQHACRRDREIHGLAN